LETIPVYGAKRGEAKSKRKAYTEITEDTEFAEKRGEEITQGGIRLAAGVMEGLTPEGVSYRIGNWGMGDTREGTGVTDMERVGEEHGGIRKETKEVKEAKEMKEDEGTSW